MQEYTRHIAYFYAYEQGRQEAAAGFVKAEVRSGRCRLGIHLNRLGRWEQGAGRVYIYFRQQGRSIGIYLGELEARNGVLEWQGVVDPEDIQEKGVHFSDTGGIWIRSPGTGDFVADWEDHPVDVSRFIQYPKGGEKCVRCPRLGICKRSVEDAADERGKVYEGSHPAGA